MEPIKTEPIKIKFEGKEIEFDGTCPQCGSEMQDWKPLKKKGKVKPKGPDFKCLECSFAIWPNAIVKEKAPVPKINHNHGAINTDAMLLSYAKDIVISEITNKYEFPALQEGILPVDAVLAEVERVYKFLQRILNEQPESESAKDE